jgi:phosphate uptake regulator
MKRKVIRQGHNTLTVTLPVSWVKQENVKPGDEISITEQGKDLLISAESKEAFSTAEVRVMRPRRLVSRHIFNLYRNGVDEIKIMYDDPIIIKDIYSYLPLLMGFEIIHQTKDSTIIRNMLTLNESEFDTTMRRYLLVTKSMAEETQRMFKMHKFQDAAGIIEIERVQNRLYLLLCRMINKKPGAIKAPTSTYLFVQKIEDIADEYKYICKCAIEKEYKSVSPAVTRYLEEINELLELLYQFYYRFDKGMAQEIVTRKKELIVKGLRLLESVPKKEIRLVSTMNNLLTVIYEAASPVFGVNL